MRPELNLCMGCMSRKEYSGPCEICGYIDNTAYLPRFLAPGTTLGDRYIVGKMLSYNGEGVMYIGYDTAGERVIELREYLPDTLCTRKKNTENVVVNDGCLPLYKSYLSEFADLYKALMNNNESESIRRVYGIFAANNTGYVVMEHLGGKPLAQVIEENGGKLPWQADGAFSAPAVKEMFPPLLTALNMLHSHGIIHRGLSPESIWVDERGRLRLTAFGTSASRTENSSVTCELFTGYAAPEQYEVSERQGTWTDIYGICSVLYRALTGVQPLEANSRELNDVLEQPYFLEPSIPHTVSDTITAGMCLRQDERIHTVNELVERLFTQPRREEPEDDGPVSPAVARVNMPVHTQKKTAPRRRPAKRSKKQKQREKESSNIGTIIGVSVFLAIVVGFIIAIVYFSQASQELLDQMTTTTASTFAPVSVPAASEETAAPPVTAAPVTTTTAPSGSAERIIMPNFVNRLYNMLENRYPMLKFNPSYEYNSDYAEGMIFEQDIDPDTEVFGGTEVNVKVSKGPEWLPLPDYIGKKLEDYTAQLGEAGIKYDTEPEETGEVKEGYVARCSKEIGEPVLISQDEKVIVYFAVKPPETTTKKSKPPRTTTTPDDEEFDPDDIVPDPDEDDDE